MTVSRHERQTTLGNCLDYSDNKVHSLTISAIFRMNFVGIVVTIL